jgi:DNA replication and repair protein RecF
MVVRRVTLADFRSYAALDLDLVPGFVLVTGPNGVGKTNLLEALHVGSQGFSPRSRIDSQLVRFGASAGRVTVAGDETGAPVESEVTITPGQPKRAKVNGATLPSVDGLRERLSALVFVPDRLAVVKGGPIVRRTYVDRMLGRLVPSRADLPGAYGQALAQRNEALRRVRAGATGRDAIAPWTERVATLGAALDETRATLLGDLEPAFAERAAALGLDGGALRYAPDPPTVEALDARLDRDLVRGTTSLGPHLRDIAIESAGRDLRSFGSQGEQRSAVLALVLAEADLTDDRRGSAPLLLLDDVLSELDETRRAALLAALPPGAQTVVTATGRDALPRGGPEPALVVEVTPGEARAA